MPMYKDWISCIVLLILCVDDRKYKENQQEVASSISSYVKKLTDGNEWRLILFFMQVIVAFCDGKQALFR